MKSLVAVSAVMVLVTAVAGKYLGPIDCDQDSRVSGCKPLDECTVTCPSPCSDPGDRPEFWGTGLYQYDGKLCRSAVHDYRIPSYGSNYNVTYVKVIRDPQKYLPTIQRGVVSTIYERLGHPEYGIYTFSSPYLTEDILDVSTLSFASLYPASGQFNQECYINDKTKCNDFNFEYYIPKSATDNGFSNPAGGKDMSWIAKELKPGGYWCNLTSNTYSSVMSLAMAADADFKPDQWTQTLNVNESVRIKFTASKSDASSSGTTWRKDQKVLYSFPNMKLSQSGSEYYLDIENLEIGDAGVYSLEINGTEEKQGIMRLLVRRCPKDYFGSKCDQQCPNCQNGGVCHDIMGTCICAPGFSGPNCDISCTAGYFGQSCGQRCSGSLNAIDGSCKGAVICLPDPYGCSCAAGFKGLTCDQACSPGDAGCAQSGTTCHCVDNQPCPTGSCASGCAEGWKSAACDTSYPYLRNRPTLLSSQLDSLQIQFDPWDESQLGNGKPKSYIVEIKDLSSSSCTEDWKATKTLDATSTAKENIQTLENLKSGTRYAVRVIVLDEDGHAQRELAPVAVYRTSKYLGSINCGQDSRVAGCDPLDECIVTCPSPCSDPGDSPEFWGTGVYSYDVKVCRSAVHDYRIPSYGSNYNVTYVKVVRDPQKYLPTIQRGVVSTVYGKLGYYWNGIFTFSSPYINENILDVATLNFMYLYQPSGNFIQMCQITGETKDFDFKYYIPKTATDKGVSNTAGGKEVSWTDNKLQPGGYWCDLVDNTYSSVMSLAMASDADFVPDQWTLTTNVNENVRIKFTKNQTDASTTDVKWKKDKKDLYSFPNMKLSQEGSEYYLDIENLETGDGGVYSLELDGKTEKQGIMRLIVRRCPKDIFGPKCNRKCPECQNGGVCHDVMGTCICAPGFSGANCETACKADTYGQGCTQSCASSEHVVDKLNPCKNALICLPDPYGCSCAAGYTGLQCEGGTNSGKVEGGDTGDESSATPKPEGQGSDTGNVETKPEGQGSDTGNVETKPEDQGSDTGNVETKPEGQGSGTGNVETKPEGQGLDTGNVETKPENQGSGTGNVETKPEGQGSGTGNVETKPEGQGSNTGNVETTSPKPDTGNVENTTPNPVDKQKELQTKVALALRDVLKLKAFNPYKIPTMDIDLGLKTAMFSEGQAFNLQNLKLTATPTLMKRGNAYILTLRIGGNDLYATGKLSRYGFLNIDVLGKVPIRADVKYVDAMMTIMIPVNTNATPQLLMFKTMKIEGVRVQQGGLPVISGILNFLTGFFNGLFPSVFEGVIKSILPSLTKNVVLRLRFSN